MVLLQLILLGVVTYYAFKFFTIVTYRFLEHTLRWFDDD